MYESRLVSQEVYDRYVSKGTVREITDLVNLMVNRPMIDKHQPGLVAMDTKLLIREILGRLRIPENEGSQGG